MKINNITSSPNFKAKFANDVQTKKHLISMINSNEDVARVCNIVDQLEWVGNDSEISLSKSGYNIFATNSSTGNSISIGNTYSASPLYNLEMIVSNCENPYYQKLFGEEFEFNFPIGDSFTTQVSKLANSNKYERKNSNFEKQIKKLKTEKAILENKIQSIRTEQAQNRKQQVIKEKDAILSLLG